MKILNYCFFCCVLIAFFGCSVDPQNDKSDSASNDWHQQFEKQLNLSGHRNWLLIVDKAFPEQPGVHTIVTHERLLQVLGDVLKEIDSSTHVKPIVYTDKELQYLTDSLSAGVEVYKKELQSKLSGFEVQSLWHDSVFVKMSEAQKLFSITVLKTEETIPYSSVFLQLDCKYWTADKEHRLREIIQEQKK